MTDLIQITGSVMSDEPCFSLVEGDRNTNVPGGGIRRLQTITVIRADSKWECVVDLGPASSFKAPPFALQGYVQVGRGRYEVLETVGRLCDAADDARAGEGLGHSLEPLDLKKGFEESQHKRRDAAVGRTRFAV